MKKNIQLKLTGPANEGSIFLELIFKTDDRLHAIYHTFNTTGSSEPTEVELNISIELEDSIAGLPIEHIVLVKGPSQWSSETDRISFVTEWPKPAWYCEKNCVYDRIASLNPGYSRWKAGNPDAPPRMDRGAFFSSPSVAAGGGAVHNPDVGRATDRDDSERRARENPLLVVLAKLSELSPEDRCLVRGQLAEQARFSFRLTENTALELGGATRIVIASHREFNLSEVDARIEHDKPWGPRDWAQGCPTATSCIIPAGTTEAVLERLNALDAVIFACHSMDAYSQRPSFKP